MDPQSLLTAQPFFQVLIYSYDFAIRQNEKEKHLIHG